jgi:hypothetical protein
MPEVQKDIQRGRVHASVHLVLDIPGDVAARALLGTEFEGERVGDESENDREYVGETLDAWVSENFHDLLDYIKNDAEAECDW